ncbi:hypothetical protein O181_080755, partial [Austropuccinia psidii MF-1]|nr:hypothetical protein [Austropuccinia psidii MF-1]
DYKVTLTRLKQDFILTAVRREVNRRRLTRDSPWCLTSLLDKDCKDAFLANSVDDIWKISHDNGNFHLFDGISYHRPKHTFLMVLCGIMLINTILLECHDNIYSGHLSEDRTIERIKTFSWWPSWRKDVIEYCHSCDRFQKVNKGTGDKRYNACLVIVDIYRKNPIFLPCHKDGTAMDKANFISNRVISHTGLLVNISSDRELKSTSALWTTLHKLLGTTLSFSTAYHPKTDGLAERMIQTVEDMIKRFCAYVLELKVSDGFTHGWYALIPAFKLAYKLLSMRQQVRFLQCWKKDGTLNASSFKLLFDKVKNHVKQRMNYAFEYAKQKWYKSQKNTVFKVGDLILVSALNFNNTTGPKKLKHSFSGPFLIKALHGTNEVQVDLSGESENKHSTFPVGLVKHYTSSDKKTFSFEK